MWYAAACCSTLPGPPIEPLGMPQYCCAPLCKQKGVTDDLGDKVRPCCVCYESLNGALLHAGACTEMHESSRSKNNHPIYEHAHKVLNLQSSFGHCLFATLKFGCSSFPGVLFFFPQRPCCSKELGDRYKTRRGKTLPDHEVHAAVLEALSAERLPHEL